MTVFIHSLIISPVPLNIETGSEISMVLTAAHVFITPRHNQLDHIFLFSISKQHYPNNAEQH